MKKMELFKKINYQNRQKAIDLAIKKAKRLTRYKEAQRNGTIGSKLDFSWTGINHSCCGARAYWKHKATCLQVIGSEDEIGNEKWKALKFMDKIKYINEVFT